MGLFDAVGDFLSGGLVNVLSGAQSRKQSKKAVQAVQDAAAQNRALYQGIYDTTRGDLAKYRGLGDVGSDALLRELGLGEFSLPGGGASGGTTKTPGGSAGTSPLEASPDYRAYLDANPDVRANYEQQASTPEGQAYLKSIADLTPGGADEDLAAAHYQGYGKTEGRALPTVAPPPQDPTAPDLLNAPRPQGEAAPQFVRPAGQSAPDLASYFGQFDNFYESPEFLYLKNKQLDAVNAKSAVRGKLRSGDAATALEREAAGVAGQYRGNLFNQALERAGLAQNAYQFDANRTDTNFNTDATRGLNQWTFNTNRADNNFDVDRGFQAQRQNQRVSNLFGLVSAGQNAAAGTATAGNIFATAAAQGNNDVASARANAALSRPNPWAQLSNTAQQVAGAYFGGGF